MYTIFFTDTFKILSKKFFFSLFCFCFMKMYLQVRIENHWTVPLDHPAFFVFFISYPPKNVFLFTQCRRLLEKFCATNSVYQKKKKREKKNTKCLSYGCRMESPRWISDVLAGEDTSLTIGENTRSLFLLKLEKIGFTVIRSQLNHDDVTVWNPRQYPIYYHNSFISLLTPFCSFFPWKLWRVAAAFLCVRR